MFSKIVSVDELLDKPLTFALGGPRSGKSTLLERYVVPGAAKAFRDKRRVVSVVQIRPYWGGAEEARSRMAAALLRGISIYVENLSSGFKTNILKEFYKILSSAQASGDASIQSFKGYFENYLTDLATKQQIDPLTWALETFRRLAFTTHSDPCLLLDDADFLNTFGIFGDVLHLCKVHQISVLANARSICDSRFDSLNPLTEYTRQAEFVCLDFLPTDETFESLCRTILEEMQDSSDPGVNLTVKKALADNTVLNLCIMLSSGQIGRFRETIGFMASKQHDDKLWHIPNRKEIGDFSESVVTQMLQREESPELKDNLRMWLSNLGPLVRKSMQDGVWSTWLTLPPDMAEHFTDEQISKTLSTIRSGILTWILHCSSEDRINVAKQSRFVPSKFKVSPLAAIANRVSLRKAIE